jgi:hypothetical protein
MILYRAGLHAANFVQTLPKKRPRSAWIWRHGEAVADMSDDLRKRLCWLYYEEPSQMSE